jgi:hypothetical protein
MKHLLAACALVVFATAAHAQMPQHAVIQPRHILPPEEFDRPYDGLLIERKDWNLWARFAGHSDSHARCPGMGGVQSSSRRKSTSCPST